MQSVHRLLITRHPVNIVEYYCKSVSWAFGGCTVSYIEA